VNILDRLLGHDAWTTRQLLLRCRELSDEQLDRQFDIAHRSVRATTKLPERPDYDKSNDFLIRARHAALSDA